MDENADGGTVVSVATENATSVTVDDARFEVDGGNLKLKAGTTLDFETDTSPIEVVITASGDGASATHTVSVSINDVNEAPTISVDNASVAENEAGAMLGPVTATDPDTGNTHTFSVSDDRFEVVNGMLKLKDGVSLDHEAGDGTVTVTVTVEDQDGLTDSMDVTITATNVDEAPSAPQVRADSVTVAENDMGASITSLGADSTDPEGDAITYHVDDERFEVDASHVVKLKDGEYLDHESGPVTIALTAMDPAGNTSEATMVTVMTSNVNEAPSVMADDHMVDENAEGMALGKITNTDPDAGDADTHIVTVSGDDRLDTKKDDAGVWWVILKDDESFDHETEETVSITVTVTDAGGLSASDTATITVGDVNEAPSVMVADGMTPDGMMASSTVEENTAGALLGEVTFSDVDDGDMHTLSVSDDRFETKQDAEGGWWLKLKDGESLDHEAGDGTVTVTVTVTDAGGLTGSMDVTITATDMDEAPTMPTVGENAVMVDENLPGRAITTVGGSSDPEGDDDSIEYHVDNEDFEIVNGILQLKEGVGLDFEGDSGSTIDLMITATDAAGNVSDAAMVTVTVGDVHENRAPTVTVADGTTPDDMMASATVAENAAGALLGEITSSDPDATDTLGDPVVSDERFETKQDAEGGWWLKLQDGVSLDYETADTVDVTVSVTDDGDPAMTGSRTVTITVTDVNEAPTITAKGAAVGEDSPAGTTVGTITVGDPDAGDIDTLMVMSGDSDFMVMADPDNAGTYHLKLAEGAELDHENGDGTVTVTVNVMDDGDPALSASTDVTITVNDVNEAPEVVKDKQLDDQFQMAGDTISWTVDLTGVFTDEDDDDGILAYSVSDPNGLLGSDNKAIDLEITVTRGVDDDGEATVTGVITSTKVINPAQRPGSFEVNIIATDDDADTPLSSKASSFMVHVDDRNDEITAVKLFHPADNDGNEAENLYYEVEVNENHDGEVNFGRITVEDDDSGEHPHGMHTVTVDAASKTKGFEIKPAADGGFWLVKKAGVSLDYEEDATHTVTITAKDMVKDAKGEFVVNPDAISHFPQTVDVNVIDQNDAPEAQKVGNWWVTVNEDLDEEEVEEGTWLSFSLETDGDDFPAFKDEDQDKDDGENGHLTYGLKSGPEWLDVKEDGSIVNKKGMLPDEDGGKRKVVVKATDGGGEEAMIEFYLTWAVSGPDNEDNDEPDLKRVAVYDIEENSASGELVATFTVNDEDSDLEGHPFAPNDPEIVSVVNEDDGSGDYSSNFEVKKHPLTPNTWQVVTKGRGLDYEKVKDIEITVHVSDGAGGTDDLEIDVEIDDVNESPLGNVGRVSVGQSEEEKKIYWINLSSTFTDPDGDDLTFEISSSTPWIKILYGGTKGVKWEDIKDGPDGDPDTGDDVIWGRQIGDTPTVNVGSPGNEPEDDDFVVVVEIDRTGDNNDQADVFTNLISGPWGKFTVRAFDEDRAGSGGNSASAGQVRVMVNDENLPIEDEAVEIRSTVVREDVPLTAHFNEDKDPDLVGDDAKAYQVIYTWSAVELDEDGDPTGTETVRQVGYSHRYTPTQEDVGMKIKVSVSYYENEPPARTATFSGKQQGGEDTTASTVRNSFDRGDIHVNFLTNDNDDGLTAEVRIVDEDVVPERGDEGAPQYTWQESANGFSGWKNVSGDDTGDKELTLTDGDGKYYRLFITYTDEQGASERHFTADAINIKVGELEDPGVHTVMGTSAVGGPLQVNTLQVVVGDEDSDVGEKGGSVQWQQRHESGDDVWWTDVSGNPDGTLTLTSDHAGAVLRAVVTYKDAAGTTAVKKVSVNDGNPIEGPEGPGNTPPTTTALVDDEGNYFVDAGNLDPAEKEFTEFMEILDLNSLFEDPDGDTLTFTVAPGGNAPREDDASANNPALYIGSKDQDQGLIYFDASTGKLTYLSDVKGGHDGDRGDGAGNWISLDVTASDGRGEEDTAHVNIRLNVKPNGITIEDRGTSFEENVVQTQDVFIARLDVQDENAIDHAYGTHKLTVKVNGEDDDRFKIVDDRDGDGSTWNLMLKEGASFDFETDVNPRSSRPALVVRVTAEDGGGETTSEIVRITIMDDPSDDPPTTTPDEEPGDDEVPGLKDDDADNDDNDLVDGGDSDEDGGWKGPDEEGDGTAPIPPSSNLGDDLTGLHVLEDDLLDSFVLAIDDIDVA